MLVAVVHCEKPSCLRPLREQMSSFRHKLGPDEEMPKPDHCKMAAIHAVPNRMKPCASRSMKTSSSHTSTSPFFAMGCARLHQDGCNVPSPALSRACGPCSSQQCHSWQCVPHLRGGPVLSGLCPPRCRGLCSSFPSSFHPVQSSVSHVLFGDQWQIMPNEARES